MRPSRMDAVRIALGELGVSGMSVHDVRGSGRHGGHREWYLGDEDVIDLPMKMKIEIVARDEDIDAIVEAILQHARTGQEGDGKIFVLPMEEAVRVRTHERGDEVL